jgi:hypothetical protein
MDLQTLALSSWNSFWDGRIWRGTNCFESRLSTCRAHLKTFTIIIYRREFHPRAFKRLCIIECATDNSREPTVRFREDSVSEKINSKRCGGG